MRSRYVWALGALAIGVWLGRRRTVAAIRRRGVTWAVVDPDGGDIPTGDLRSHELGPQS